MRWDNKITERYRDQSIRWADELVVGETYYYSGQEELVLLEAPISHWEFYQKIKLPVDALADHPNAWALFRSSRLNDKDEIVEREDYRSLRDMCIGNGGNDYNPWLLFKDKETAKAYYEELNKTVVFGLPSRWE
jgi:hypothetical protein